VFISKKQSQPCDPQITGDSPFNDRSHQYVGPTMRDGEQLRKLRIVI
jgi:hypothetical protein